MRYERSESFKADYKRLSAQEKQRFKEAAVEFSAACDRWLIDRSTAWSVALRVKPVQGAPGVFEMTWSFTDPDGRATWEWVTVTVELDDGSRSGEPAIRWRRVGGHAVFGRP